MTTRLLTTTLALGALFMLSATQATQAYPYYSEHHYYDVAPGYYDYYEPVVHDYYYVPAPYYYAPVPYYYDPAPSFSLGLSLGL